MQTVDLQRAIGLIQLVKTLHDNNQWEAAKEHYQTLREMLTWIIARCLEHQIEFRERLTTARTEITLMDDLVRQDIIQGIEEDDRSRLNQNLNNIQSDLEELASVMGFGESQEETK